VAAGSARSGTGGRDLLADEPDDAPARDVVRGVALGGAPGDRLDRPVACAGAGATADRLGGDRGRHAGANPGSPAGGTVEELSKNFRYSTNVQIAIDADTRLVIATGDPQPGNRNDCTVYRSSGIKQQLADRQVITDGGYQGNPEVIMLYRKPRDGTDLPDWKEELNASHRKIRARVVHALA
jgi:hypothetical protein